MDKKFLFIFLLLGMAMAVPVYADFSVALNAPVNHYANNSNNETTTFTWTYTGTNTTANCSLLLNNASIKLNVSENNTATTHYMNHTTLSETSYDWGVNCTAGTTTSSKATRVLWIDRTNPNPVNFNATAIVDGHNATYSVLNFTCRTPVHVDNASFTRINLSLLIDGNINATTVDVPANGSGRWSVDFQKTGVFTWGCMARDNATNSVSTSNRTFTVDTIPRVITQVVESKEVSSDRNFGMLLNYTVNSLTFIDVCYVKLYDSYGTAKTITGTKNQTSNNLTGCSVTVANVSGLYPGRVRAELWANNTVGLANTSGRNETNLTGLIIYPGWNMVQLDRNTTLSHVVNYSSNFTQASWWNNTAKSYNTCVKGVITNCNTGYTEGDAIWIYSNLTTYLVRNWSADSGGASRNMTLEYQQLLTGWNQVSHFNTTLTFQEICHYANGTTGAYGAVWNHTSAVNFTVMSYWLANESRYVNNFCSLSSGRTVAIPRGTSFWANINTTAGAFSYRILRDAT